MRNAVISSSVAGAAILGTDVIGAHANADADSKHARAVPDGDPEEVIHHPGKHKPRRPSHTATHKGPKTKGPASLLSDAENVEQKDQLSVAMRSFEVEKMRLVRDAVEIGAKMCNPALFVEGVQPGEESEYVLRLRETINSEFEKLLHGLSKHIKSDKALNGFIEPFSRMKARMAPLPGEQLLLASQRASFTHLIRKVVTYLQKHTEAIKKEVDIIKRERVDWSVRHTLVYKIVEFAAIFTSVELRSREAFKEMGDAYLDVAVKIWAADDGIEDVLTKLHMFDPDAANAIETIRMCPKDAETFAEQVHLGNMNLACSHRLFGQNAGPGSTYNSISCPMLTLICLTLITLLFLFAHSVTSVDFSKKHDL